MASSRGTTVRRVEEYLGPDIEIKPEDLVSYESTGEWLIQPKFDGMWSMLTVGNPAEGRLNILKSRDARTPEITGAAAGDLPSFAFQPILSEGDVLIGELEAASQWAKEQHERLGVRRVHLFDIIRLHDEDLRNKTTVDRYHVLSGMHYVLANKFKSFERRFPLVPTYYDHFRSRYDQWVADGLEGCVIKKRGSLYHSSRMDGKTDDWLRCKKFVTEDYVLCGLGMTSGGMYGVPRITGRWGLFVDGELSFVFQSLAPEELLIPENVGKLVCEFRGWERFKSGALRHAHMLRVRQDKSPEECILRKK